MNGGMELGGVLARSELANASTIDGGVITNHGELEATAGSNTIKNVTGANFTNTGIIEVVAGSGTVTLVLDGDYLTNTGTVLVDALSSEERREGKESRSGWSPNHYKKKAPAGTNR